MRRYGPRNRRRDLDRGRHAAYLRSVSRPGRPQHLPDLPGLAGQQKDYIVEQLKAYRDKTRADPHARTYMWGPAARLSDPTIDAIADYYSSHNPVAGEPGTSPEIAAGKTIFTDGIPSESVPARPVTASMPKVMARFRVSPDSTRTISHVSWKRTRQWSGPTRSCARSRKI
jgi:hypothetical protein